jgi:hypothetical protein
MQRMTFCAVLNVMQDSLAAALVTQKTRGRSDLVAVADNGCCCLPSPVIAQSLALDEPQRLCRREDGDALEDFEGE